MEDPAPQISPDAYGAPAQSAIRNSQSAIGKSAIEPTIHVLPPAVTSCIAAGEVVERPASVIKELVENALDAGASQIDVELAGGGRELIRVRDNGRGMSPADLSLCLLPHATSKLTSAEQLTDLRTLGFRGEALAAISAVSRFSLLSAQAGADAWRVDVAGGEPSQPQPKPCSGDRGTTAEARELFFNLPARAKFLKGQAAEAAVCADCLLRLALTRPDVAFVLHQDRHEIFNLPARAPASRNREALTASAFVLRARDVLGRQNSHGLLEIAYEGPGETAKDSSLPDSFRGYRLYGLISPPPVTRPNRSSLYLSVNGRAVRDRLLTQALLESYRHLLPAKRYPLAVLFLDLPGADVDINVHPTKAEVRFRLPGLVYALFHHAVRSTCGFEARIDEQALDAQLQIATQRKPPPPLGAPRQDPAQRALDFFGGGTPDCGLRIADCGLTATPQSKGLAVAPPAPQALVSPTALSTQHSTLSTDVPLTQQASSVGADEIAPYQPVRAALVASNPQSSEGSGFRVQGSGAAVDALAGKSQEPRPKSQERAASPQSAVLPFRILGQSGGSYIVLEDDLGLKVIDQHALHERVLFEDLLARLEGRSQADSQGLLLPETLELTPAQAAFWAADDIAASLLAGLGFEVESFGSRTLVVRAVPAILRGACARLVGDVLESLASSEDGDPSKRLANLNSLRERAVASLACKAAIKAGERLTIEQMTALMTEYRRKVRGLRLTCPHGRPVAVELSWEDLERGVGRR
ncbi:MAG TPA: DNA mismatch repair endonuclease MutL [Planctomycetota bacterium]|jgi:DNA mismatch repair protein MutL